MKLSKAAKEALLLIGTGLFIALVLCLSIDYARAGDLPDHSLTPGALDTSVIDDTLTIDQLCTESTSTRRHVTQKDKNSTFAAYGIHQEHRPDCTGPSNACYEIDHLCSLELGCNNVAKNRWPQAYEVGEKPYDGQWGAHKKDDLENHLHAAVCKLHTMTLEEAQQCISTDWIDCYQKVMP